MEKVSGLVERITFQSEETGFTVAKLNSRSAKEFVCIVGVMPSLQVGECINCSGAFIIDRVHGQQFKVEEFEVSLPKDAQGVEKYLGSGLFKGIGPSFAKKVVGHFKEETLAILNTQPEKLLDVPGIGEKRLKSLIKSWQEQAGVRDVMIFLQGAGVGVSLAQKIYRKYGQSSIDKITENPYRLSQEIFGVGFKTSDQLAQKLGMSHDAPERIDAGIEHILYECGQEGHTTVPQEDLIERLSTALELDATYFPSRLIALEQSGRIERQSKVWGGSSHLCVSIRSLARAESGIAAQLARLQSHSSPIREVNAEKAIDWVQKKNDIELADEQREAIESALKEKILLVTGGPGTGKSTLTCSLLEILRHVTKKITLVAPTGRAAKRLSEVTGWQASTIHSLLEVDFQKGGFKKGLEDQLDCEQLIVDEASMVDTHLMHSLLKALPDHCRLLLIGDIHQLPSVGPGAVLSDLIASQHFCTISLKKIFRQAQGSQIILNAHRINQGKIPWTNNSPDHDFFFIEESEPEKILRTITSLVSVRLPRKYGFHCLNDIQVLTPMRRGILGTENLNTELQNILNHSPTSLLRAGRKYAVGDKVMQIRNNYNKEVFNGDIGTIQSIDLIDQEVMVRFLDKEVVYEFSELNELLLAYAVSIHKYQGSESPCVVLPIHTTHFKLLNRNLLYTGVTRGKKLVIVVGTKKALAIAARNAEGNERYTLLQETLAEKLTKAPF